MTAAVSPRNAKLRNFAMTVGTRDSRKIIGRYNLTGVLVVTADSTRSVKDIFEGTFCLVSF